MDCFLTILFLKVDLLLIDVKFSSRLFQKTVEVGNKEDLNDYVPREMLSIRSVLRRLYLFPLLAGTLLANSSCRYVCV